VSVLALWPIDRLAESTSKQLTFDFDCLYCRLSSVLVYESLYLPRMADTEEKQNKYK